MFQKTLVAAALLALGSTAMAADVAMYGRIDTGLQYNRSDTGIGDAQNSLKMHSGQHDANRFGLKGSEKISDGMTVGFQLETGFNSDDGTFKNNDPKHEGTTLFDREAQLYIAGDFGKIGFGRMGLLRSGAGSYNLLGSVSAMTTGWGSVGDQGAILASLGTNRMDNTITYQTPELAGFKVHLQYSMGGAKSSSDAAKKAVENESSADRYYGLGLTYTNGPLNVVGLVDTVNEASWDNAANTGMDKKDMKSASFAVNYDFDIARVYFLTQYFKDADALGGMPGVSSSKMEKRDQIKGWSVMTGFKAPVAGGSWRFTVGYMSAEDEGAAAAADEDNELKRFMVGTGYDYPLSKNVSVYGAAGYWKDAYKSANAKVDDPSNIQVVGGMLMKF